jgi:hypothetical protein
LTSIDEQRIWAEHERWLQQITFEKSGAAA